MHAAVVLALVALVVPAAAAPADDAPFGGLTLTKTTTLDSRLTELTFTTPALSAPTVVRVLVPAGYASSTERYPVLYLLHGCCDYDVRGSQAWTTHGDAEKSTAGLGLIVVMPDAGDGGFYSDWYNNGAGGPPEWETYHIAQLIPWIDAHYRTIADRDGRAVAGLSMGGYGAMEYGARHPDMFVSASSFSGAVDNMDTGYGDADAAFPGLDGGLPDAVWGTKQADEIRWRGHDPNDLAANLKGLNLTIRTGNGQPGGPYGGGPDGLEMGVHDESVKLDATLTSLGLPHVFDDYGPGAHSWPYWSRDLVETLPDIMKTFAAKPPAPDPFTFTTIDPAYDIYGYHVALNRPQLEFSTLKDAGQSGFSLLGSGSATVTTAARYQQSAPYVVSVNGQSVHTKSTIAADGDGRLKIDVPLGPDNQAQEYTPLAEALGTTVYTTTVQIAAAASTAAGTVCASHRSVRFTLPRGLTHFALRLHGRLFHARRSGRFAYLSLHGLPRSAVSVTITGTRPGGTRYTRRTTLHPCTKRA